MWELCANLFLSFHLSGSEPEPQESWYQLKSYRNTMVTVSRQSLGSVVWACLQWCPVLALAPERGVTALDRANVFSALCFPHVHPAYQSDSGPQCISFIFCQVLLIHLWCQLHLLVLLIPHFPLCSLVLLPQALKGRSWAPITGKTLAHNCRAPSFRSPKTS